MIGARERQEFCSPGITAITPELYRHLIATSTATEPIRKEDAIEIAGQER